MNQDSLDMRKRIESLVHNSFEKIGIDISYVESSNSELYSNYLKGAAAAKNPLNIVQVGANDGKYNDPIYEFVKRNFNSTNIILIEPLETLIPHLKENYSYHPSFETVNKAITNEDIDSIRLYRVKKEFWGDIESDFSEGLPEYRVATGVTTSDRDRLLDWISQNVQSDSPPDEIIEGFEVEVGEPDSILGRSKIMDDVQVLQVDTEGMDDKIVYSFLENDIYPGIINIESKHLHPDQQQNYDRQLNEIGYEIYDYTASEKLAIKTGE
jgi:FkbM family methyltransferase